MLQPNKENRFQNDPHGIIYKSNDVVFTNISEADIHTFILEKMNEAIFVIQDLKVRYANDTAAALYGMKMEQLIGMEALPFVHPDDQPRLIGINKRRWEGEFTRARYEYRMYDAQGTFKWVQAESLSIEWGGQPAVLQNLVDVTERKNYEQELAHVHEIIRQSSSIAFLWKNEAGWPVEYVTENVEKLFGYTAEEFTTGAVSYATLIHPEDLERAQKEVEQHSNDHGQSHFEHTPYRIITKDNKIKWIEDKTEIRYSEDGVVSHFQGIVQDITEKKQAQEEREQLIEQLQSAIAQIKTLQGLIPICSYCKKVRNDDGYWNQIEEYISKHSDAHFSHSICPTCEKEHFPEISRKRAEKEER